MPTAVSPRLRLPRSDRAMASQPPNAGLRGNRHIHSSPSSWAAIIIPLRSLRQPNSYAAMRLSSLRATGQARTPLSVRPSPWLAWNAAIQQGAKNTPSTAQDVGSAYAIPAQMTMPAEPRSARLGRHKHSCLPCSQAPHLRIQHSDFATVMSPRSCRASIVRRFAVARNWALSFSRRRMGFSPSEEVSSW
jgi:hypothetical protein